MSLETFSVNTPLEKILRRAQDYDRRGVPQEERFVPTQMVFDAAIHLPSMPYLSSGQMLRICGMLVADPCPYCGRIKQTPKHETCDGCGARR